MDQRNEDWKPPFASREIIHDYKPLKLYLEEARRRGREDLVEKALLSNEDFAYLLNLARETGNLLDLIEMTRRRFVERIDGEIAREAFNKTGVSMNAELARERLAYIIAGWLIEAGKYWKILSFKEPPR